MSESLLTSYSAPSMHSVDLSITVVGLDITVSSGSIYYGGTSYSIPLAETHAVGSYTSDCVVSGYLVLDTSTGSIRVFVDELILDEIDVPYDFTSSPYELITPLYLFEVPVGTTELSTLPWRRWRIIQEP